MINQEQEKALCLIRALSDGEFHAQNELEKCLVGAQNPLSFYLDLLPSYGIDVIFDPEKGWRLPQKLSLLDQQKWDQTTRNVLIFDSIPSTNQFVLENITQFKKGDVCLAEHQSNGRGRRGGKWFSPFGVNLYLSFYWHLPALLKNGLSLAIGIALAEQLSDVSGQNVQVKWPNDLYLNGKKMGGILIESLVQKGNGIHFVIGCGLNLMMNETGSALIAQKWTNLQFGDRNALAMKMAQVIEDTVRIFEKSGLTSFQPKWQKWDVFYGQDVTLISGDQKISGVERGIDENGALILQQGDRCISFDNPDFSLRLTSHLP